MPFYRCNPKGSGGGGGADDFYVTVGGDTYVPCSNFLTRTFNNVKVRTFNDNVIIGNNVFDCTGFFSQAEQFNNSLTMGSRIRYMDNMFMNCFNFNQPVIIGDYVVSCSNTFNRCPSLNCPVTFKTEILDNATNMFFTCSSFNQPINISFNANVNHKDNTINLAYMLNGLLSFNSPVTVSNGKNINTAYMFQNCGNFNAPVNFETSDIMNGYYMFANCLNLNSSISFGYGDSTVNNISFSSSLYNCQNLNKPVTFTSHGNYNKFVLLNYFMANCMKFNQPFVIPNGTLNCAFTFSGCTSLNSPITFSDSLWDSVQCTSMFFGCTSFNQAVTIPINVRLMENMFANCTGFGNSIYIKGNDTVQRQFQYATGMFRNCNKQKRKCIYVNNVYEGMFRGNAAGNSVVGAVITWANITNGYYNATYNIYIYNDYEG